MIISLWWYSCVQCSSTLWCNLSNKHASNFIWWTSSWSCTDSRVSIMECSSNLCNITVCNYGFLNYALRFIPCSEWSLKSLVENVDRPSYSIFECGLMFCIKIKCGHECCPYTRWITTYYTQSFLIWERLEFNFSLHTLLQAPIVILVRHQNPFPLPSLSNVGVNSVHFILITSIVWFFFFSL